MITTEAWVLKAGCEGDSGPGRLERESFRFPDIGEHEVLVEPLIGCWEGNMSHAISRMPVDIARERGEATVVLGNAGVARVLRTGTAVQSLREGDLALVFCNGVEDRFGYPEKIYAYDAPGSIGLLAKRTKLHAKQLIKLPAGTRYGAGQWAAFSLRYITAWANWRVAYQCWRSQFTLEEFPAPRVWGWGGGVSWAELLLAKSQGAEVAMISADPERLRQIATSGMRPINRRLFPDLEYDEQRYRSDSGYKKRYSDSEDEFAAFVREATGGEGVSIFLDYVGTPVCRATLRALSRGGVVATAGWKGGMRISTMRAIECIQRHIHVHTHYARRSEAIDAMNFAEANAWLPQPTGRVYSWDEVPELAAEFAAGSISDYFPLFEVNR